jgi:hypothetical protein
MWAASTKPKKKEKTKETKKKEEQQRDIKNQERTRGRKETETKIKNVYPRSSIARCTMDSPQMCMSCNENGYTHKHGRGSLKLLYGEKTRYRTM